MPNYPGAVQRTLTDKLGESISVLDFGAVGDGTTDDQPAFAAAVSAADSVGGCEIVVPKGTYKIDSPISLGSGVSGVRFVGDGSGTVIERGAMLAASHGLFDVSGRDIQFRHLTVDGGVTAPAHVTYGTFTDPLDATLATNSSFWLHGGASAIRFVDVTVRHTGGYAILLDATGGDIANVKIVDCTFENNRPHLFGPSGDTNYGSWTGGIHYQGNGTTYAVSDLLVQGCTFRRNTGNCCWGHLYGFGKLHSNIHRKGNTFLDIGLDGIEMGGEIGGSVEGNLFRRIGYICLDDTSASTPKQCSKYACAIDSTGLVRGVNVTGNTIISANGGSMDLDGYCQGTVSGNTCIMPAPGDPEYTEDQLSIAGPGGTGQNWTYGVQPSNTNNVALPASDVSVVGNTFVNMGGGAIRMFAARNCLVHGNSIDHPAGANYPPISLGNIGTGPYQRATGTVVLENRINYDPSVEEPAVFEDATYGAFSSACKNWVSGNRLIGNCYEFKKDPNSSSSTSVTASSTANSLATRSENVMQREGSGNTAVHRVYQATTSGQVAFSSLFDVLSNGSGAAVGGPLFNVSNNGGAGTGSFSTAGRTTAVFDDAMLTGKVWSDAFIAVTDSTYVAAHANLLPSSVGLLRFNSSTGRFLQSVATSSGVRVWVALGGLPLWVTMVDSGAARNVQIAGSVASPAIYTLLASNGTDYADWTYNGSDADFDVSLGGINLRPLSSSGAVRVWNPTSSIKLRVGSGGFSSALDMWHDGANANIYSTTGLINLFGNASVDGVGNLSVAAVMTANSGFVTSSTAGNAIQAPNGGILGKYLASTSQAALAVTSGALLLGTNTEIINTSGDPNARLQVTGYGYATIGWASASSATDTFHAVNGGVTVKYLIGTVSLTLSATSTAVAGNQAGRIIFDGTHFKMCPDGTNWYDPLAAATGLVASLNSLTGALTLAGTASQVVVSSGGSTVTLSLPQNIGTGSSVTFGNVTVAGVFQSTATGATISFQNSSGNFQVDGNGNVSGAGQSSFAKYLLGGVDSLRKSGGTLQWSHDGSTWYSFAPAGGVSSLNSLTGALTLAGTASQVVVSSGGSTVTLSLPQNIGTGSSVTFGNVTVAGVFQSTATGATISFQNSSGNFQVDGNGNVSGAGQSSFAKYLLGGVDSLRKSGGTLQWSHDGSTWYSFAPAGGVSSLNSLTGALTLAAGVNVTISPSGGTLTISAAASGYGYGAAAYFATVQVPNASYYCCTDTGGNARAVLSIHSDNNLYLDNVYNQDVYIRPASGRYVFLGYGAGGAGEYVCPNGNVAASLGTSSYRWNTLYVQSVSFSSSGGYSGGTGISVSGATITNTGVTAVYSGGGISVNANTGGLTVSNTGVTAVYAGTGISVNSNTGGLTVTNTAPGVTYYASTGVTISSGYISIGQAVGTGSAVSFYSVSTSAGMQINQGSGYGLYLPYSYVYSNGINSFSGSWNGIQSSGGVSASSGFYMSSGTQVINSSAQFCGNGVSCPSYGIQGSGFNPTGWIGQSYVLYFPGGFQISGYTYYNARFVGGVFVQAY